METAVIHEALADSIVCDLTLPWQPAISAAAKAGVLQRWHNAGIDFVSLTVGDDENWIDDTLRFVAAETARIDREGAILVRSVSDIERAQAERKLAVGFHFQGTNPFQGKLEMVEAYYALGVRHALLAYNRKNLVGDGCHERTDAGLSRFGLALIAEMNRVGMLVDCTHSGIRTTLDAMEASSKPCIFSHSVARALHDHERNITDEQIKACAATGGVIGVNGIGFFLSEDGHAGVDRLCAHIDHIAEAAGGPQYVALGLDFVYFDEEMQAYYKAHVGTHYPKGYPPPPWEYLAPEALPQVADLLLKRGYSAHDVRGIFGENFLRVARAVWRSEPNG